MLIASYFVGRDKTGSAVCIVVKGVFLDGYIAQESELEYKVGRTDLVQVFEQDGYLDGFILPDLPEDVVNLLGEGRSISIVDVEAEQGSNLYFSW
jgi:hypothetical protein